MWFFSTKEDKAADVLNSLDPELSEILSEDLPVTKSVESAATEKINDRQSLLDAGKSIRQREKAVSRAARANCAIEEFELHNCFFNGSWADLTTACDQWAKRFWRCLDAQKHTLTQLNYGHPGFDEKLNDIIQGKADNMYQQYLRESEH